VPILGTSPEAIDAAEDREAFGVVLQHADLPAPAHGTALSDEQARSVAQGIGYPVLVRPSYVLGGRGMEIVYDREGLVDYLARAGAESGGARYSQKCVFRFGRRFHSAHSVHTRD